MVGDSVGDKIRDYKRVGGRVRALVTGAHGFIGSHLFERLLGAGFGVRALVSPWGSLKNLEAVQGLELLRADITNEDRLKGVCDGVDVVFHAAARVADWGPWEAFHKTNVLGTQNLLRKAERAGVRRFVLVSSVAVFPYTGFRNADARLLTREAGGVRGGAAYARSKIAAEDRVMGAGREGGLEGVIVRPGLLPFGPRDANLERVVGALKRGLLPLVNGGRAVMNTAYVENLVEGLLLAGTVPEAAGKSYVIADAGGVSWRDFFGTLAELLDVPKPRLSLAGALPSAAARPVETLWAALAPESEPPLTRYRAELMRRDVHFSLQHAFDELEYRPQVTWREGLARTVAASGT